MTAANRGRLCCANGTTIAVVTAIMATWVDDCNADTLPRACENASSSFSVMQGVTSAIPKV